MCNDRMIDFRKVFRDADTFRFSYCTNIDCIRLSAFNLVRSSGPAPLFIQQADYIVE